MVHNIYYHKLCFIFETQITLLKILKVQFLVVLIYLPDFFKNKILINDAILEQLFLC